MVILKYFFMIHVHQCILFFQIGKGEPKAKQVKLAQKARKPQAAKNGPKKAHPCDQCEKSFGWPSQLKVHMNGHLGLRPFKCTQCDMAFGQKSHLNQHIKSAHENAFVCPTCDKAVGSKDQLQTHISSVHEGIKLKCDLCDAMVSRANIARHKRTTCHHKKV